MAVALAEWAKLLDKEYLADFIMCGGAAVKIAVAPPESAPVVKNAVGNAAEARGYVVVHVDAADTKVQMVDALFHAAAHQVDWAAVTDRWLARAFQDAGLTVPEGRSVRDQDIDAIAEANELSRRELNQRLNRLIRKNVFLEYGMGREFRTAMARLCSSAAQPQDISPSEAEVIIQWLKGEKVNLSALKRLQIYQKITRQNARLMLQSLAVWLHAAGYAGLALVLDLNAVVADVPAGGPGLRYTRAAVLDAYETLRQFIDDTDESSCLLVAAVAGPGLLDDAKRGVDVYTALKMRIIDEVRDRNRANPLNAMARLDAGETPETALA